MKKLGIVMGLILAMIILRLLFVRIQRQDFDVTKEQTRIGIMFNGQIDDQSWGQSHYEGIMKSADELNLRVIYKENVPVDEGCLEVMEEFISDGCEIIIGISFEYGEFMLQEAKKHPDVYFLHATGVETAHNLSTYFGRIYQMRYLSGIVAGLKTKTGKIGYVAAFPISEVNRGINAFTLGVRSVNPEAVVYVEWSSTWMEDEETRQAAEKLLEDKDIDVVAMHTNSLEVMKAADEHGVYSIGYNIDNSKLFPDTYLTAPIWNWTAFYSNKILACMQKKLKGEQFWEGVETGIVSLAEFTPNVEAGTDIYVNEAIEKMNNGQFDVFYGPVYDNNGNLRVAQGENMSDDYMLNEFNWYVEGVIINE